MDTSFLRCFIGQVFVNFPGAQTEEKESQGGGNTHRHVHAFTLSMTVASVSDGETMTHSGIQFHVPEPTGTPARTRAKR